MRQRLFATMIGAGLIGLAGCGEDDLASPQQQVRAPQETAPASSTEAAEAAPADTQTAVAPEPGTDGLASARQKTDEAAATATQAGSEAWEAASAAAGALSERGGELAATATERAREMIAGVQDYLAENDLSSAQGILDRLEGIQDALPEAVQTEIDQLKERVNAMTDGGGASPSGPEADAGGDRG